MKRTPLFAAHQQLGAKMVEFGGWEMPVYYTSITEEHLAVRRASGLFDISHMGEVFVNGPQAAAFLNHTLTNDVRKLTPGTGQYTLMCNPRGGVIDDLYVYHLADQQYLLIVNASRIAEDVAWLEEQRRSTWSAGCSLANASDDTGALAVQGPLVSNFIDRCFSGPATGGCSVNQVTALKKNQIAQFIYSGGTVWVARTGYTGEDGFEVVAPSDLILSIWDRLLESGQFHGLKPAGLGARDTLRTEVCYPLYGHELNAETTPMEAGLGFFVGWDKGEFIGRGVLAEQKSVGVTRKLVAFKMTDKSPPPRPSYPIWSLAPDRVRLGEVCSGTQSPSLSIGIGLGYVPPEFAKAQTRLGIEIRGRHAPAIVTPKPIYRKPD